MQINRLLEMVYILLDKKTVTAKELSEYFQVSQRTIFRDIDILSVAGIPIYTNRGKGGGIRILDNFVINKSVLSDIEQVDILSSLQGLNALNVIDVEPIIKKLANIFNKKSTSWLDVDFSNWASNSVERDKFKILKTSILNRNTITFDYFNSCGEKTERTIEPMKLIFKGQGWYIYGFCRTKEEFRFFKVTRLKNITCSGEVFEKDVPEDICYESLNNTDKLVDLVFKVNEKMIYRIFDEFDQESIVKNADGSFTVTTKLPEDEWVYGYILSYGDYLEVLEPKHIREVVKRKIEDSLRKYI